MSLLPPSGFYAKPKVSALILIGLFAFQVQQRDNEINILVSMLKKREAAMGLHPTPALHSSPALAPNLSAQPSTSYGPPTLTSTTPHQAPAPPSGGTEPHYGSAASSAAPLHQAPGVSSRQQQGQPEPDPSGSQGFTGGLAGVEHQHRGGSGDLLDISVLADRGKAFDLFRWGSQLLLMRCVSLQGTCCRFMLLAACCFNHCVHLHSDACMHLHSNACMYLYSGATRSHPISLLGSWLGSHN